MGKTRFSPEGRQKRNLLKDIGRQKLACRKRQLQVVDDPFYNGILRDEIDDLYRPPALGADHRVNLIDLPDYGRPILGMAPFLLRLDCHIPLFSQKPNSVGAFSPISQILATPL
jgi:hypothetical protein